MTTRDRIVLTVIPALAVLALAWFMVVAPEREQASKLNAEVSAASQQRVTGEALAAEARSAQARYQAAYTAVVRLGKAVPPTAEVPSLIYELDQVSHQKSVDFNSISAGGSAAGGSAAGGSAAGSSGATAVPAASSGFSQMPFTFVFSGSFTELYRLLNQLDSFTALTSSGALKVSGRLLTIQSVSLAPGSVTSAPGSTTSATQSAMTGTITATAYVLGVGTPLTGGATPASPGGATAQPTSGGASSATTTPAVAR